MERRVPTPPAQVLALCGSTPGGARREALGKYTKLPGACNGYPHYASAHDPSIVLYRMAHRDAWTVGDRKQASAKSHAPQCS